jgi:hypothetical protein
MGFLLYETGEILRAVAPRQRAGGIFTDRPLWVWTRPVSKATLMLTNQ